MTYLGGILRALASNFSQMRHLVYLKFVDILALPYCIPFIVPKYHIPMWKTVTGSLKQKNVLVL